MAASIRVTRHSSLLLEIPVVTLDGPAHQHILDARAAANVMNDLTLAFRLRQQVSHHTDVVGTAAEVPRDNIARKVIIWFVSDRNRFTVTSEVRH